MFSNSESKIDNITKRIPVLGKIPRGDRLKVFKQTFHIKSYRIFLGIILTSFIFLFYFNLDQILDYKALDRVGMIARNLHFLQELGTTFFLPLVIIMLALVMGRNYFMNKQIEKYINGKNFNNTVYGDHFMLVYGMSHKYENLPENQKDN